MHILSRLVHFFFFIQHPSWQRKKYCYDQWCAKVHADLQTWRSSIVDPLIDSNVYELTNFQFYDDIEGILFFFGTAL